MLRDPKSFSKKDVVIEDPIMGNFFIVKLQTGGYSVNERVKAGNSKREYVRIVCYPSTFAGALKAVSLEMLHSKNGLKFSSVEEYITEWKDIEKKFDNITI